MRQQVLGQVQRGLAAVISRRVGVALGLWGEAGIGKTHEANALLRVVPCASVTLHATIPLSALPSVVPLPRRDAAGVERRLAPLATGAALDPAAQVSLLGGLFTALAPVVVLLEDLHEASDERRALLVALAGVVRRSPGVALLVTSRAALPAPIQGHRLPALDVQRTEALLHSELGRALPDEALAWIQGRTKGNPLFALEFARYLSRQGHLWSDGQRWHWRPPERPFLPVTVEALIERVIADLPPQGNERVALEALAALPARLDAAQLEGVWAVTADLPAATLTAARRALEARGLLSGLELAHPLFGEVVARGLPAERRRMFARRALKALLPTAPLLAADLLNDADLPAQDVMAVLTRAAELARPTSAGRWLRRAAELASGAERVRLALRAIEALNAAGDEAGTAALARLALAEQPDHRQLQYELARALAVLGHAEEVRRLLSELPTEEQRELRWVVTLFRAQVQATTDSAEATRLWDAHPELVLSQEGLTLAVNHFANAGDLTRAEALIPIGLALPDLQPKFRLTLLLLQALIRSARGHLQEALPALQDCLVLAREEGNPHRLAGVLHNYALTLSRLGRHHEALASLQEKLDLYRDAGMLQYGADTHTVIGLLLIRLGRFEDAEAHLLEAHGMLGPFGLTHTLVSAEWVLAALYLEWRTPHSAALAEKFAASAVQHARALNNPLCLLGALPVAVQVAALKGRPEEALALAREAEALGADAFEDRHAVCLAVGRALEAAGRRAEALAHWEGGVRTAHTPEHQHELALEHARMTGDERQLLTLHQWFTSAGLLGLSRRAEWYRSTLDAPAPDATPAPTAHLVVLGPPAVSMAGQAVKYRGRKRLELLAFLLEVRISGRREATVLDLLDALYPDEPEIEARNTVKQQVYLIRTALGAGSVLSTPGGYALGAVTSDAEDFLAGGATEQWRGPYLGSGLPGWLPGVRDALTQALRGRILALRDREPSEAARLALLLCEMEPYDADALRLTLTVLTAAGQAHTAQALYRTRRTALQEVGERLPESPHAFLKGTPV